MSKSNAPTGNDLIYLLQTAHLMDDPPTDTQMLADFAGAIDAAVSQWTLDTGYVPFLAVEDTRTFDPPGPEKGPVGIYLGINNVGGGTKLFVHTGLVSVATVTTGLSATNTTGTVLTVNQDYWLSSRSAPQYGRPYSYIEFRFPQWGIPASIKIDGVFGYALTWPDDAWQAVLRLAGLNLASELALLRWRGATGEKQGDESATYAPAPFRPALEAWQERYNKVLANYARMGFS